MGQDEKTWIALQALGFPFKFPPLRDAADRFSQGKNITDKKILISGGALEEEDAQFPGYWIDSPSVWSHAAVLMVSWPRRPRSKSHTWFPSQFPPSSPTRPMVLYVLQHRTESRCNQVTPITQPYTAVAHISWATVLREISLCTIPMSALSHCLQISRKKKKIHKYRNTIIQLPHGDPECCWKEHHVQPCKYKSLQETRRALNLHCSNVDVEWAATEITNGDIVCSWLIKPLSSFNKMIFR